jgi:hypothetical protein
MSDNEIVPLIIEHRITKVNGEIGFKKYKREKLLGRGILNFYIRCICKLLLMRQPVVIEALCN